MTALYSLLLELTFSALKGLTFKHPVCVYPVIQSNHQLHNDMLYRGACHKEKEEWRR